MALYKGALGEKHWGKNQVFWGKRYVLFLYKTRLFSKWRRDRDSNPGRLLHLAGFQDQCIQPLCHLSDGGILTKSVSNHKVMFDCLALWGLKMGLCRLRRVVEDAYFLSRVSYEH